MTANVTDKEGQLYYNLSAFNTSSAAALTEVKRGLFFDPQGDTVDLRGRTPIARNYSLVKTKPDILTIKYGFFALCGLLFLATIFTWPAGAIIHRIRHKSAITAITNAQVIRRYWFRCLRRLRY